MNDFISKFKQTSYYQKLFDTKEEILLIYLGGSRCFNTSNEFSDYDINIITLAGGFTNVHEEYYLMYNNKKVQCFYRSIRNYFDVECNDIWMYTGILTLKGISNDVILYKNSKYENILEKLYNISAKLLVPVSYNIFEYSRDYMQQILDSGCVRPEHYRKALYFLCLASFCLFNEPIDSDFLAAVNVGRRIKYISDEYREQILTRLICCKNYIEKFPLDTASEIERLYQQLKTEISCDWRQ
jgi:hypothetical protein